MAEKYTGIVKGNPMKASDIEAALDLKVDIISLAGLIFPYAGATEPTGWAFCDGREVVRADYPQLFAAIGTVWGTGDGLTTFNLPDLRGATIRGAGISSGFINTQNNQADNVVVTLAQRDNDAIRNIAGHFTSARFGLFEASNYSGALYGAYSYGERAGGVGGGGPVALYFDASRSVPTASENKVKARGVNFIIKLV